MSEQGIIRVALRAEGDMLVAYLADDGPTEGSRVLGSIAQWFVRNADISRAFLELMQDSLIAVMPSTSGVTFEEWDETLTETVAHEDAWKAEVARLRIRIAELETKP